MQTDRQPTLLLTCRDDDSGGARRGGWLGLDVRRPQETLRLAGIEQPPADLPGAILVVDADTASLYKAVGGSLRLARSLLWSLLDPGQAKRSRDSGGEGSASAEQRLRAEARSIWERLGWWRQLPATLRANCRESLAFHSRDGATLLSALCQLAEGADGNPFAGWQPDEHDAADSASQTAEVTNPPLPAALAAPEALENWMMDPAGLGRLYGEHFFPRREQADMAGAVARALAQGQALLVEAGTGVGKTLAYLTPLLAAVRDAGCRAVISTYTLALQTQIMQVELPLLAASCGQVRVRLLKGRAHYLCRRQHDEFLMRRVEDLPAAWAAVAFRLWLASTTEGRRDELADNALLAPFVPEIFGSVRPCSPNRCFENDSCFVQRARRRGRQADLLIVNHALLMHDLQAGRSLIGPYDLLVVDEAHRLPQVALESHGIRCDAKRQRTIEEFVGAVQPGDRSCELPALLANRLGAVAPRQPDAAAALIDFGKAINRVLRAYGNWWRALRGDFGERIGETGVPVGRLRVRDKDEHFAPARKQTAALLDRLGVACAAFATVGRRCEQLDELPEDVEEQLATLAHVGQLLESLQQDVRFITADLAQQWVTWLEANPDSGLRALGATLLEAGELLRDYWLDTELDPVMCSATLAVGEDFSFMLGELGLTRRRQAAATALVASPFAYETQTLFLTNPDLPAPDHPDFAAAVAEILHRLLNQTTRKSLALFTSYRLLQEVGRQLHVPEKPADDLFSGAQAEAAPALLLQQPTSETGKLLVRFRDARCGVLLGTTTFWEGVDFPGSELEILVVTKLPFLVPSDPWVEARCERLSACGENPFSTFMVRDAVIRLRQGIGRLVRRVSDRGIVVLLDNRLHTKRYGGTFLNALPVTPRTFHGPEDLLARIDGFFAGQE